MKTSRSHTSVAARFNAAAGEYHARAGVQLEAAKALMDLVDPIVSPSSILEIGCGTGALTELLIQRFPNADITALDIAGDMVREASNRIGSRGKVLWHIGDLASLPSLPTFDCVISSAALHWMRPLDRTFSAIAQRLMPSGHFMFSLMLDGTLNELHVARRRAVPGLPPMASLPDRAEIVDALGAAGFKTEALVQKTIRVLHRDGWQMMRDIHAQGLTGGDVSHGRRLLTRTELKSVADQYDHAYKTADGVPATYEIGLVQARAQFALHVQ